MLPRPIASDTERRRLGLRLGLPLARLGVTKGGLAPGFGCEDHRLLLAFGLEHRRLLETLRLQHVGALLAFGLHLPGHRRNQFLRRCDILDFDALNLYAPRRRRRIDDCQKLGVDAVALGQQFVEVHRAHDRADIGHHQIEDRELEIGDLIGRLCGIQHLIEDDGVDRHHGVVSSDDALRGDIEHRLHHVHPRPDAIDDGDDQRETRPEGADISAKSLDRPFITLGDPLHRKNDKNECEQDDEEHEDGESAEHDTVPLPVSPRYSINHSLR